MTRSEYLAAGKDAIRYVKSQVRYRGLNTAGGWIRNPTEVPQKFAARIESKWKGAQRSDQMNLKQFDGALYVDEMDKLAKETGTGNCSELSAVAFKYLRAKGVGPIEYFGVYRGSWNHAFVVMGRNTSIPIANFADWSVDAAVCDPLYDRSDIAGMLAPWYPRILPLRDKDVKYRAA